MSDVNISTDVGGILLNIRASKTDPFRSGCKIHIGPTDDHLCPVNALHVYIRYRNLHVGPLFVFSDGTYLTRSRLCSFLSSCFGHAYPINTHSFRIGGASALAAAGVPDATIQVLGRWASNCFTRYLQPSPYFHQVVILSHGRITNFSHSLGPSFRASLLVFTTFLVRFIFCGICLEAPYMYYITSTVVCCFCNL